MPVNLYQCGEKGDGYILMTQEAGFSGIAGILSAGDIKTIKDKYEDGKR